MVPTINRVPTCRYVVLSFVIEITSLSCQAL